MAARENARLARQYITLEMWEQINRFYLTIRWRCAVRDARLRAIQDFFR